MFFLFTMTGEKKTSKGQTNLISLFKYIEICHFFLEEISIFELNNLFIQLNNFTLEDFQP